MCGIVGVLGNHQVAPILVEALKRLEYRGYDSAGIATVNAGHLERRRAVGKLVNLSDRLVEEPLSGEDPSAVSMTCAAKTALRRAAQRLGRLTRPPESDWSASSVFSGEESAADES